MRPRLREPFGDRLIKCNTERKKGVFSDDTKKGSFGIKKLLKKQGLLVKPSFLRAFSGKHNKCGIQGEHGEAAFMGVIIVRAKCEK